MYKGLELPPETEEYIPLTGPLSQLGREETLSHHRKPWPSCRQTVLTNKIDHQKSMAKTTGKINKQTTCTEVRGNEQLIITQEIGGKMSGKLRQLSFRWIRSDTQEMGLRF